MGNRSGLEQATDQTEMKADSYIYPTYFGGWVGPQALRSRGL